MNSTHRPVRVGIAGLGRSGWNIHAATLAGLRERFQIVSVTDTDAERCRVAAEEVAARPCATFQQLIEDSQVELVVVATPNRMHAQHAIAALRADKAVICEKPVGINLRELDEMIAAAERSGRVLAPFQQRRYEPHFQKVMQVVSSGVLGKIVFVRIAWHGFKRRWDWQTLQEFGGGSLNNNGPHLVDHAVALLSDDAQPDVFCDLQRCLTSGDAEDHVKIVLKAPGQPTIDIELSDTIAFGQDRWLICGTGGGLRGSERELRWKYVDWSAMPPRPVVSSPTTDRSYNGEKLSWVEESWTDTVEDVGAFTNARFYEDLYLTLREGAPLAITPRSVRRRVQLMERCHQLCPLPRMDATALV